MLMNDPMAAPTRFGNSSGKSPREPHVVRWAIRTAPAPPPPPPRRRRLLRRCPVSEAAVVLMVVLRNSLLCAFIAILASFVLSKGNILTFRGPADQSTTSFTVGIDITSYLFITFVIMLVHSVSLAKLKFISKQGAKASTWWCFRMLYRRMRLPWLICGCILSAITFIIAKFSTTAITTYKAHLYAEAMVLHTVFVYVDVTHRSIFQTETLQGQVIGYVNRAPFWKRFWKHQTRHPGIFFAMWMSIAYVHCASTDVASANVTGFSVTSVVIKLALQELAKREVLKRPSVHATTVYVAVMVPTVLISTQMRVVLIRSQAKNSNDQSWTILGTMGLVEIGVRIFRTVLVRWELRRHRSGRVMPERHGSATTLSTRAIVHSWSDRRLLFQTAEILAEMHSEYMAIACSVVIYSFLGGHPKYSLPRITLSTSSGANQDVGTDQITVLSLLAQLALAITVDMISCIIEISYGVPLAASTGVSSYLSAYLAHLSCETVVMSALAYLSK